MNQSMATHLEQDHGYPRWVVGGRTRDELIAMHANKHNRNWSEWDESTETFVSTKPNHGKHAREFKTRERYEGHP